MTSNVASIRTPIAIAIVLGCRIDGLTPSPTLSRRLEKAWQFCIQNPHIGYVIFSGGGKDEAISEAEVMSNWWNARLKHGSFGHELNVLLEKESLDTLGNAQETRTLLEKYGLLQTESEFFLIT